MRQFGTFLIVGGANTALGWSIIFTLVYLTNWPGEVCNAIGYGVGVIGSYLLHRTYTFKSVNNKRGEFLRFMAGFLFAYALNLFALTLMLRWLEWGKYVSQAGAAVVYVIFSYLVNRFIVFRVLRSPYSEMSTPSVH